MEYDVDITTKVGMDTCPEMGYTVYWYTPRYKWLFAKMTWNFGVPHFQTQPFMDEYGWYVLVCDVFGGQLGNSGSGKSIDICRLVFYIRYVKAKIRI